MGWVVSVLTIASIALLLFKRREGWIVGAVANGCWIAIFVERAQWDLLVVPVVIGGLHVIGIVQWKRPA